MSQHAYNLTGSKTRVQTFRAGIAMATVGVPVIGPPANESGVVLGTTTTGVSQLGMNIDAVPTYNTAQQTDNSDPAVFVKVVTNPDAVWQTRISGAATSGSAAIALYNVTASTNGLTVVPSILPAATSGGTVDTSAKDDCVLFCYSGANAGHYRRIEPADATNADVTVAWQYDIAVDDRFMFIGISEGAPAQFMTFTTTLDEMDGLVATAINTASYFRAVELVCNDEGNNGLLNSYVNCIAANHQFSGSSLA